MSWTYFPSEPTKGELVKADWGREVAKAIAEIQDQAVVDITSSDDSVTIEKNGNSVDITGLSGMPDADEVTDYMVLQAQDGKAVWDWVRAHA